MELTGPPDLPEPGERFVYVKGGKEASSKSENVLLAEEKKENTDGGDGSQAGSDMKVAELAVMGEAELAMKKMIADGNESKQAGLVLGEVSLAEKTITQAGSVSTGASSERGETTPTSFGGKKSLQSYVSVAQDKKVLRKYEVAVLEKGGSHSVLIPDDVLTATTPLWEDFIVGKFLDISPHVAKVHMVLNKIWKYGEVAAKVEVFETNATTMRFRVSNPKAREKILRRGVWNIFGVPMVVSKWTPWTEEEKQDEEVLPMWVHLRRVPLHMFSWEGLSFITSAVGFPVKLHSETIACTNFEEAKVFARVNITKPLPKEINFTRNGKDFAVDFRFPGLPTRCTTCNKWGHTEAVCRMNKKEPVMENKLVEKEKEDVRAMSTTRQEDHGFNRDISQEGTLGENIEERSSQTLSGVLPNNETEGNNKGETVWSIVSPTKVGRSPVRLANVTQKEEIKITASKFSVLSKEEEEEEEGEINETEVLAGNEERKATGCLEGRNEEMEHVELPPAEARVEATGDISSNDILSEAASSSESDLSKVEKGKGVMKEPSINKAKEKKAKPQNANSTVKSTRSSRRLH